MTQQHPLHVVLLLLAFWATTFSSAVRVINPNSLSFSQQPQQFQHEFPLENFSVDNAALELDSKVHLTVNVTTILRSGERVQVLWAGAHNYYILSLRAQFLSSSLSFSNPMPVLPISL